MTRFSLDYANTAHNIVLDLRSAKHVFFEKKLPGIAIFEFSRVSDGRVNLNRLVFRLFQLINSIFRSKILARVMAGANLVYSDVNVWLKLKIFNGSVVYGWRNNPRNRPRAVECPFGYY